MKKIFTYLLICLCILFLTACPYTGAETIRMRSFVTGFGEPAAFRMELTDRNNIALYWEGRETRFATFRSQGLDRVRYDELAARYNDLSYNRIIRFVAHTGRDYVSNGIASIEVVSDADFDTDHPAGTSLAHFVHLLSASPIRFIESGYRETFDWNNRPVIFLRETSIFDLFGGNSHRFPVNRLLAELEPDDFRLLGIGQSIYRPSWGWSWFFGFLVFDKEPENLGTHNLTVTIYRTCGQVLRQTIAKTFGE